MKATVIKLLLRLLLMAITRRTAVSINGELIDFLKALAARTHTDLDEQLVELLSRFLQTANDNIKGV